MSDLMLLVIPIALVALVAVLGFVGCTNDYDELGVGNNGGDGGNGGEGPGGPKNYSEAVISSGPVAYWRLSDPAASPTAHDEMGNHDGSYQGSVTHGGSPPGLNDSEPNVTQAIFDGVGSVQVDHTNQDFETPLFTVELLVRLDSVVAPRGVLVSNMSASGGWELVVVQPPGGAPALEAVTSAGGTDRFTMDAPLDLAEFGTARQVAMTFDGTTLILYKDGLFLIESGASVPYAFNTSDPLQIGTDFQGEIQEVAVYDQVLDDELGWHLALKGPGQNP